jgi:acyl-CoA synthetase (AMP-forming)/AMP-acid ligase II
MSDTTMSMSHLLREAINGHAKARRTAFLGSSGDVTYAELGRLIDRHAAATRERGIRRGELVGIAAVKGADSIGAFLGTMQAGACPCFVEPRIGARAIAERMRAVGVRHLLLDGHTGLSREALAEEGISVHALAATPSSSYADDGITGGDRAMVLFTSGSTGRPKGVVLSHTNLRTNATGVLEHTGVTPADRLLHLMPLHHTNGVNNQLIVPLLAGASIVLTERFRAEEVIGHLRRHSPTYVTGVPTMYSRMLPYVRAGDAFPSLRFLRCGSAPITVAQHERFEEAFGVPLVVSYGLSEATCTSTMNPPGARRVGTVGTVLRDQRVRLFHPGTDRPVAPGASGEIRIGGPALMTGYLGAETDGPIVDGWLRTGDLGRFDSDGYLSITGRIKDVIIRGGENLSPALIEGELATHPAVRECCVVGRPDADLGEVPVAFVALHDPRAGLAAEELQELVRTRLSHVYVPAEITMVDALPVNGVGKVDRVALRAALGG